MEEDSNVYTVEAQDDVEVQDEEVIQALSGVNIVIESQDLGEDEGATSKRDKGKQVIRDEEAEQYHVIKARLSRLFVEGGSQEDDIIEEEEEDDEQKEEEEDSDQTLDGGGEVDEMVEEELREEDRFNSIEQVIANGPRSSPKLRHVLSVVTEASDEGIGTQDGTESSTESLRDVVSIQ